MATASEGTSLPRPAVAFPLPRLWLSDATGKRREVSETGGDVPQGRPLPSPRSSVRLTPRWCAVLAIDAHVTDDGALFAFSARRRVVVGGRQREAKEGINCPFQLLLGHRLRSPLLSRTRTPALFWGGGFSAS